MRQPNIILTGFMGTGKSTIGRKLAERLGRTFVDTDQLIEDEAGCTIADIFAQRGEAAFRTDEERLVKKLAQEQGLIIATGGGLVMNPDNVTMLQTSGRIFCLTATPQEIYDRTKQQPQIRPLLQQPQPLQRITDLLQQRQAVYQQFSQLDTSGKTVDDLVDELLTLLQR